MIDVGTHFLCLEMDPSMMLKEEIFDGEKCTKALFSKLLTMCQ